MDNHCLRAIILQLQDRLSDNDRTRLHFYVGNHVPRGIRDNSTLSGTLNVMESLFDQDKISEENFTFLINAFKEIRCDAAVKILQKHRKQMQSSWLNQQALPSKLPLLYDQVLQDQEDKSCSQNVVCQFNDYGQNNKVFNTNNTNINPVTITVDQNNILAARSQQKRPFYISLKINKYLVVLLLMIVLIIGMGIYIVKQAQTKTDTTSEHRNNLTLEKNKDTGQLDRSKELNREDSNLLIKAGMKFGSTGGDHFDDSLLRGFTCSHYLNGIVAHSDDNGLESYEFHYISSDNNKNPVQSEVHSNRRFLNQKPFDFDKGDKICKVEGQIIDATIVSPNGTNLTIPIITGIQFSSESDLHNPTYNGPPGKSFTEEFKGYTLGYVNGRSRQYIEQLQFFWYRNEDTEY